MPTLNRLPIRRGTGRFASQLLLASPVAGTQLLVPPADRLALLSVLGGDFAAAWARITATGQRLLHEGQPVRDACHLAEVAAGRAAVMADVLVPRLAQLGIVQG